MSSDLEIAVALAAEMLASRDDSRPVIGSRVTVTSDRDRVTARVAVALE